jgi:hypothetical protein
MICTGAQYGPVAMQHWLELYNNLYRLNYDLCRIWWGPALDIYLGTIRDYQNKVQ